MRYRKSLVCIRETGQVEDLYEEIDQILSYNSDSYRIDKDDIGFITAEKNSLEIKTEDFLEIFSKKSRALIIATHQLLSEGFDDKMIDSVYITYPSKSFSNILQTGGRAMRRSKGKTNAAIFQVIENDIDYFFNHHWLYQDITDRLRPAVISINGLTHEQRVYNFKKIVKENGWQFSEKKYTKLL